MSTSITEWDVNLGQTLQKWRKAKNQTQKDVADACGLTKNYISALERGCSKCTVKTLMGYCKCLQMTPSEILGFEDASSVASENSNIIPELRKKLSSMDDKQQTKVLYLVKALYDE